MKRAKAMVTKSLALLVAAAALGLAPVVAAEPQAPAAPAQADKAKDQPMSFWMERKLHLSQELLAGISSGDFDKITTSAQAMRSLNKVEAFMRGSTPGYRAQLSIFEESLNEIIHQADKDNLEGAALGFTQLTISCVNCHKQLRAAK